jgi:hypothetical protein
MIWSRQPSGPLTSSRVGDSSGRPSGHAGTRASRAALLLGIAILVAACASAPDRTAAGTNAGAHNKPGPGAAGAWAAPDKFWSGSHGMPAQFISLRYAPTGASARVMARYPAVALSNSRTGAMIRRLLPGSRDGMQVAGLALDRAGNLWVTYSRGPVSRGDLAGGDPKPHSCANEIMVAHGVTGRLRPYLRTGHNVLISGATLSPDGKLLAYRESACATGYFNDYLRVTSVVSGQSWTIGGALPRCHWITDPVWAANGRSVLVGYAPAASAHYTGPQGTCLSPRTERLVDVAATAGQPGVAGATASPARGCQITSAAGLAGSGALAIQACGGREAWLLVLTSGLRQIRQFPLGRCTDGNELNPDLSGRHVLVSAYLYCNPPGTRGPITRVWSYSGHVLRPILTLPGDTLTVAYMTW